MATRNGPDDPRCRDCPNNRQPKPGGGEYARCKECREKHRVRSAAHAEFLKSARRCVVCRDPVAPDRRGNAVKGRRTTLCAKHQRYYVSRREIS
jgi:hypothetical protein